MPNSNYQSISFMLRNLKCQILSITPKFEPDKLNIYNLHRHHTFELHAVLEGNVDIIVDKKKYSANKDQGILISPDLYHKIYYTSDDLEKICISFDLPHLESAHSQEESDFLNCFYESHVAVLPISAFSRTLLSISKLKKSDACNSPWDTERLKALTTLILCDLYDELRVSTSALHDRSEAASRSVTSIIDDFFNIHYNKRNGNVLLAKSLHMSTRQLNRFLQKHYNMGFREKLLEIRLNNALDYLTSSSKSISEISELIGYNSQANFCAFIKKSTGKSPSDIRRSGDRIFSDED